MNTNIVLIHRTGGDFRMTDVYLLASHIHKYWTNKDKPNIYCYSDSVAKEISVVGLTIRPLPNKEWAGWWAKMNLYHPDLREVRPFLYIDLDTAILKSLVDLVPPEDKKDNLVTLRDFYRPHKLASGLMWIPSVKEENDKVDLVYSNWIKSPSQHIKKYRGDQDFVRAVVQADLFWQDISKPDFITTFKPNNKWRTEFPSESAVVCFHGYPRIPQAASTVNWVKQYVSYEI